MKKLRDKRRPTYVMIVGIHVYISRPRGKISLFFAELLLWRYSILSILSLVSTIPEKLERNVLSVAL